MRGGMLRGLVTRLATAPFATARLSASLRGGALLQSPRFGLRVVGEVLRCWSLGGANGRIGQLGLRFAAVGREGRGESGRDGGGPRRGGQRGRWPDQDSDVKGAESLEELLEICRCREGGWFVERTAQSFHRLKQLKQRQRRWSEGDSECLRELGQMLEDQAVQAMGGFNARHISLVLNAYAAAPQMRPSEALFKGLELRAFDMTRTPRDISNYMWACAKIGMEPSPFVFWELCIQADVVIPDFNAHDLSNFMWACATLGTRPSDDLFKTLCGQAEDVVHDLVPQAVSNFTWACATLGMKPSEELFGKLCGRAEDVMHDFVPQEVANLMWACATLGMKPRGELFGKLCGRAEDVVHDFKPQNVANLMWACATLGMKPHRELFGKLCGRAEDVEHILIPQDIANLMWACATLGMEPSQELFGKLCGRAEDVVHDFKPQAVSNLMWACATLGMEPSRELFGKLCLKAEDVVHDFNPQAVSNLMWACATLGMEPSQELFGKLCGRAEDVVHDFVPQAVANFMWACATLGIEPGGKLFGKLCGRAEAVVHGFKPLDLAHFMWSCAVFGRITQGVGLLFHLQMHLDAAPISLVSWDKEALSQAHQFIVTCDLESAYAQLSPRETELLRGIKEANGELCLEAFTSQRKAPSQFQQDVASAVRRCGAAFEEEAVDAVSGYSIDILVCEDGGKGLAIEVDGPWHFLGGGRAPKGSTVLKRRHLEQLGYRAASVPHWEWQSLQGENAQEAYVRALLRGGKR